MIVLNEAREMMYGVRNALIAAKLGEEQAKRRPPDKWSSLPRQICLDFMLHSVRSSEARVDIEDLKAIGSLLGGYRAERRLRPYLSREPNRAHARSPGSFSYI